MEGGQNHKDGDQGWTAQYQKDNQVSQDSPAHSGSKAFSIEERNTEQQSEVSRQKRPRHGLNSSAK